MESRSSVAGAWTTRAIALLQRLQDTQAGRIATAAEWSADAIAAGGLVHMFGSGHSRIAVEEMFPRYGSFPGFHPLVELSTTFHTQVVGANGQRQAMFIERTPGLAEVVLSNFTFGVSDVMLVFSVSGASALPVEMAIGAKERGLRTIAVTSIGHSTRSTPPPGGSRLMDVADLVIDIGSPPGDALVTVPGLDTPVSPSSSVLNVAVVNELKAQTAELLVRRGFQPPVLTSSVVVGAGRSEELFKAAYDEHAVRLAAVLSGGRELPAAGAAADPTDPVAARGAPAQP